MTQSECKRKDFVMFKKLISILLSFTFITTQPVFAQGVAQLNMAQYLGSMPAVAADRFRPLHMRYFSYDIEKDNFQLLLDKGDNKDIKEVELQEKTKVLMEYFQIGLALPNDKFWVNLRPDAQDQIIDPELEQTDLGKIMLEADLQLKKDTASFTSPQTTEGRQYWDKLYKKAGELFGTENITIPTITRPWIVPGEIILRQGEDSAYIFKANMKVMLEHDYLVSRGGSRTAPTYQQYAFSDPRMKELNEYSTQLIRELIIPKLTKEVNTSKRYAALRQVFFSLVMARWFKDTFTGKPGQYASLIDSHNLNNLTSKEAWSKTFYFNEYKKSFEQGEYNLKENIGTPYGQIIRSYVSGGIVGSSSAMTQHTYHNGKNNDGNPKHLVAAIIKRDKRFGNKTGNLYVTMHTNNEIVKMEVNNSGMGEVEIIPKSKDFNTDNKKGSSPMEAGQKDMDSFSLEQIEEMRKLEQRLWVIVKDIEKILDEVELSKLQNKGEIEITNDGFKGIHRMLAYLKTLTREGTRIEINNGAIDGIADMFSIIGLVDILPEGYEVRSGPRLLTLRGSISELKQLQEDWEKWEVNPENVVKRIVAQIGSASEEDIKLIVKTFREEINRNPTVEEAGEILGDAFVSPKGDGVKEMAGEKIAELKQKASSSAMKSSKIPENTGGIDFRAMNYMVQPMGSFKDLRFGLPTLTSSALERIDLDQELDSLRNMVKAGLVPSGERVKEYLAACFQKGKIEERQDDLLVCLAEIYRLAEEENLETSPELRESLVIVDTGKFVLLPNNQKVGLN
ncbi:MAG: hypothetical protein Q7J72_00695 [Candidatus Omnitrophota bacterium]|nr:hypothetical protein [Candidatus Omnitrophota bacterium]